MKISTFTRILREDLKGAPDWVTKLIGPINSFMETTYLALNKNIDEQNTLSQIREITYVTSSAYPTQEVVEFPSLLKIKPTGLQLLQIYDVETYEPPAGAVSIPWVDDNGTIRIFSIPGLVASKTYLLRVRLT